jgi:hypothetical protein
LNGSGNDGQKDGYDKTKWTTERAVTKVHGLRKMQPRYERQETIYSHDTLKKIWIDGIYAPWCLDLRAFMLAWQTAPAPV